MGLRAGLALVAAAALTAQGALVPVPAQESASDRGAPAPDTAILVGVAVEVELDPERAAARVVTRHRLAGGAAGARLPVVVFLPEGAAVEELLAEDDAGAPLPLALEPAGEHVLEGVLTLPAAGEASAGRTVVLRYRVGADGSRPSREARFDVTVPVALVRTPAAGSPEGFFTARVDLPESWAIWESFPVPRGDEDVSGGLRRSVLSLPVAPSFLRLRGGTGDRPPIGVPEAVDLGMALAILLLSGLGWRWARDRTRAPRATRAPEGRSPP